MLKKLIQLTKNIYAKISLKITCIQNLKYNYLKSDQTPL